MPRKRKTQELSKAPPPYPNLQWFKRHHAKRAGQVRKPLVIRTKTLGRLERDLADLMVTATVEQGSYQKRLIITCNREILWTSRFDGADEALSIRPSQVRANSRQRTQSRYATRQVQRYRLTRLQH